MSANIARCVCLLRKSIAQKLLFLGFRKERIETRMDNITCFAANITNASFSFSFVDDFYDDVRLQDGDCSHYTKAGGEQ